MRKQSYLQIAAVALTLIVLAYIVYLPVGVADGGGLYKTVESLGLLYKEQPSDKFFHTQYTIFTKPLIGNTQSAIAAALLMFSSETFNVRSLAVVYCILLLLGIFLAIKSAIRDDRISCLAAALCVLIFADISYTAYFNTLYAEGAIITTFLICVSLILNCYRKKNAPLYLSLPAALFALAFAFCGTVQAACAIVIGFMFFPLAAICKEAINKISCFLLGVCVIVISASFAANYKPVDYEKNIYNAVFFGTARHESVEILGLDPSLDILTERFYNDDVYYEYNLKEEFFDKINYKKIIMFYMRHPRAFARELNSAVKNAFNPRPLYLGNYTSGSGKPGQVSRFFSLYSSFKAKFVPNTAIFTSVFFLIYFGILIYIHFIRREKYIINMLAIEIGIAALVSLVAPFILSGQFEIGRSLFTFNIMFDSMVIVSVVAGSRYALRRRSELVKKYGLNQ